MPVFLHQMLREEVHKFLTVILQRAAMADTLQNFQTHIDSGFLERVMKEMALNHGYGRIFIAVDDQAGRGI